MVGELSGFNYGGSGIDHGWGYSPMYTTGSTFGRWSLFSHNGQNPYSGLNNSYHYNNGVYYNGYGDVVPFSRVHNYIDYKLGLGKWVTFNRWSEKGKGGYYLGELTSMAVWVLRGRDPMSAIVNQTQENDNLVEKIWNSTLVRARTGDALFLNTTFCLAFLGGGSNSTGLVLPLRGPDAFKLHFINTVSFRIGGQGG